MNTLNKQPIGTIDNDGKHLKNDFLLRLLDEFEDYLDFKGVRIPNEERDLEESDGGANIWGEDFDYLMNVMRDVCQKYGIIVDDEWEGLI